VCLAIMVAANWLGPRTRDSMLLVATDSFKIVLAALVGALSAILGTNKPD
jgi:hypothetical protein